LVLVLAGVVLAGVVAGVTGTVEVDDWHWLTVELK
jgi:hypothetical protein